MAWVQGWGHRSAFWTAMLFSVAFIQLGVGGIIGFLTYVMLKRTFEATDRTAQSAELANRAYLVWNIEEPPEHPVNGWIGTNISLENVGRTPALNVSLLIALRNGTEWNEWKKLIRLGRHIPAEKPWEKENVGYAVKDLFTENRSVTSVRFRIFLCCTYGDIHGRRFVSSSDGGITAKRGPRSIINIEKSIRQSGGFMDQKEITWVPDRQREWWSWYRECLKTDGSSHSKPPF